MAISCIFFADIEASLLSKAASTSNVSACVAFHAVCAETFCASSIFAVTVIC